MTIGQILITVALLELGLMPVILWSMLRADPAAAPARKRSAYMVVFASVVSAIVLVLIAYLLPAARTPLF